MVFMKEKINNILVDLYRGAITLEQAQQVLDLFVVSVSVCPKCGSKDLFKSLKAELYDCKCCGLRWANERAK
jgi:uncharacterized protein (DUF983 family)